MIVMDLMKLMRPWQWYKNFVVFIPLIFSGNLFNFSVWPIFLIGFIVLCFVSSICYTINDITDIKDDRQHPQKKHRPLASGRISIPQAGILIIILGAIAAYLSWYYTTFMFQVFAIALFVSILAYSLFFKKVPIVDIHVLAGDFVIRALAGTYLIGTTISPWFILAVFLLALFLAVSKRKVDIDKLGKKASRHKSVYKYYSKELLHSLINIILAMLLISYALYTFSNVQFGQKLMFTIPFASFLVFRYLYFVYSDSEIARHPERVFKDPQMIMGMAVWLLLSVYLMYF